VKRVGKLRPMRRAISSLLECPWVIIKSCFPAEHNFPPVFWMLEVAHASDQSRMSWTDENHHLILTTLSAKAALVFSQRIRRGAKCRKEPERNTHLGSNQPGKKLHFFWKRLLLPLGLLVEEFESKSLPQIRCYTGLGNWNP
jgi:hypothetical protein